MEGQLISNGTADVPIRLTGAGREAVFDNGGYIRAPDPVDTLIVITGATASVDLRHTIIENTYCGLALGEQSAANITLENVEITNTNIVILIGKTSNAQMVFSQLNLHDSHNGIVFGPSFEDAPQTTSILLHRSTPVVRQNTFYDNQVAITDTAESRPNLQSGLSSLEDCDYTNNWIYNNGTGIFINGATQPLVGYDLEMGMDPAGNYFFEYPERKCRILNAELRIPKILYVRVINELRSLRHSKFLVRYSKFIHPRGAPAEARDFFTATILLVLFV